MSLMSFKLKDIIWHNNAWVILFLSRLVTDFARKSKSFADKPGGP